jgi:hypothetical protein
MAKQTINIGTLADDGTGDTLRASLDKCNDNFTELYALTDGTGAADVLTLAAATATLGDTTISDATPVIEFKDSSCSDSDVNFDITVAATDTGSGTEDIDVTFAAQVAGTKVSFLNFDADGRLALGYNGQVVHVAQLVSGNTVTAVTTTASPASTDSGTLYTNEGDGDGAAVTLPTAKTSPSLIFKFYVQAAQTLTITAGADDTIRIGSSVTAAAGSITSATVGSSVTLECINATEWVATASVGSWSF